MNSTRVPAELLEAVKREMRPVRPLASPGRRALMLAPLALVLLLLMPTYWGWRANFDQLAVWASWGLSALEAIAGISIVAAGFRESIPGRELSAKTVLALLAVTLIGFAATQMVTDLLLPTPVRADREVRYAWECLGMDALFALPALLLVVWLAWRALPNRPALTGMLCGLGVGMMADAGVRLFCWISEPTHVLIAHGGAVILLMAFGAVTARVMQRIRS